jgi:hypothetical protein
MKRLVPLVLMTALVVQSGCHVFSKKKNPVAPKESPNLATDVEKDFMHRWIEKRSTELMTKGLSVDTAHDQAVAEYKQTFAYTRTVQQAR